MNIKKRHRKMAYRQKKRKINYHNFFSNTYGVFKICKPPKRKPDYKSEESFYFYINNQVYRFSNHWSNIILLDNKVEGCKNISSCFWELYIPIKEESYTYENDYKCGKIHISNFKNLSDKFLIKNIILKEIFK